MGPSQAALGGRECFITTGQKDYFLLKIPTSGAEQSLAQRSLTGPGLVLPDMLCNLNNICLFFLSPASVSPSAQQEA